MELSGQLALVTGVSPDGGLGFEIAKLFAAEGADVVITGRDENRNRQSAELLDPSGEHVRIVTGDLRNSEDVRRIAREAGPVTILVNNAAAIAAGPTTEVSDEGFADMFAVNVHAPHILVSELVPGMIAAGSGQIVNISSIGAKLGTAGRAAYASSKAAIESLTKSWAVEYAQTGVRVNAVAPGPMHGPKLLRAGAQVREAMGRTVPLGRTVGPDEIAQSVLFLVSTRAQYATGAVLAIDGGRTVI
ncbi:SDR family oxidoreductase [Herbiconiux sp. CPCC 205763]|uniref:SDR family oxidoreductase n=1 Tax=Herbiconiux aconitum TaxID=2970913 RepID=A0ABT2GQ80_9MICO|nr:SDR family NAD(P)-dependent oxidoreductase [Herbiconiux aconitum]MCS5717722.1 SDR family oxidoreductase [Herbiconiux aconitum]